MKLFSMPSTCALSVHIVLEWIGVPFDVEVMNHGDNRSPDYLAINPSGQVPALQLDDGTVLTEAAAILAYLGERYPEAGLGSDGTALGSYRLAQLLSFLTGEVHVAFKPYFMPQRFLDDEAQFAALKANAFVTLTPLLVTLEARLGADNFILDDRRSVADAYLYILLRWVENAPNGLIPYPALIRFRARMESDPAVARALAKQRMLPVNWTQTRTLRPSARLPKTRHRFRFCFPIVYRAWREVSAYVPRAVSCPLALAAIRPKNDHRPTRCARRPGGDTGTRLSQLRRRLRR